VATAGVFQGETNPSMWLPAGLDVDGDVFAVLRPLEVLVSLTSGPGTLMSMPPRASNEVDETHQVDDDGAVDGAAPRYCPIRASRALKPRTKSVPAYG